MRKSIYYVLLLMVFMPFLLGNNGCDNNPQKSTSGVDQVRNFPKIPRNSRGRSVEQQNIWDRIKVTTDSTKILWNHLIALDGTMIKRMPVRNKVTSGSKRLEPTSAADASGYYPEAGDGRFETNEIIQADGTFGHSDPYVFWFDPMNRYHQLGTAGGLTYLLTDYPIDLENPIDKITGLYNAHLAAAKWQALEETKLKKKEKK